MLQLAEDLALPLEAVTQKFAVFGQSGSGKSYAAMKLAELMLDAGARVIVLDAVGRGTMVIQVQSAELKTMSVEIRALVVGGKQVTLSVFRQLQNESVIGEDGTLKGEIWGRVNYFWGECTEGTHLHVVWQRDGELRRACVRRAVSYPEEAERELHAALSWSLVARVCAGVASDADIETLARPETRFLLGWRYSETIPRVYWPSDLTSEYRSKVVRFARPVEHRNSDIAERFAEYRAQFLLENPWLDNNPDWQADRLRGAMLEVSKYEAWERRYAASYATCAASQQLFIAV